MDEDWWFERGQNEYKVVEERLIAVFEGADTLTARLLLCAEIVKQLSTRFERPISRVEPFVTTIAHALSDKEGAGKKTFPLSFLDGEQFHRESEALEKISDPAAFVNLQWALDRLETIDGYGMVTDTQHADSLAKWAERNLSENEVSSIVKARENARTQKAKAE